MIQTVLNLPHSPILDLHSCKRWMPRLPPSLIRSAHSLHPLLPRLLRPCRDLESARNELRWLREHAIHLDLLHQTKPESGRPRWQHKLSQLCRERERGKPLQYVIGLQPFGDLEILCRRGVLTPRYAACMYHLY